MGRRGLIVLFAALGAAVAARPAPAQTALFGKNKIQYTDFEWRVLESEHLDLYYYAGEDSLAHTALRIAGEAYDDLSARFRHEITRRIPLIIYSSHQEFEQTNVSPYLLPEGVAGFTEFLKGRVALPFNGSYRDFEHVIRHELVHVFQLSRTAEDFRLHYRTSYSGPPLWFVEGMAEAWSGDWDATGDLFLSDLLLSDLLPPIQGLWRYSGTFVLYKIGQDLLRFLEREYGPDLVPAVYDELWRAATFEEALARVTETPIEMLSERWHHDLRRRYYPRVAQAEPLDLAAAPLAVEQGANFQAAVPPPGSLLDPDRYYFLSPRNGFMNIYAGSLSGKERDIEEVVRGQRRPEFESFHGYESRMSISRDGLLAFVSKFHERDGLFLYDLRGERLLGKWQFEGLISLRSPAFRPDGGAVALVGLSREGMQDLYLFDLDGETLRPITADRYQDDDPAWSPDGRTLAFVSDRVPWGERGARNIFLLDLASGSARPLTFGNWADSSPSWSWDGRRIAYSSTREGYAQIFLADSTGASTRVSAILGGATDPVWHPDGRDLLFTGMAAGRFGIYRMPVEARGDTLASTLRASQAPGEPEGRPGWPGWRWRGGADSLVARERPYRSRFTLDIAQGGIAVEPSVGSAEGLQALFSDQLGDRLVFLQVANTAQEMGDLVSRFNLGATYFSLKRRLNYGGSVYHFAGDFLDELGRRTFERRAGVSAIGSYPFSRYTRLESSLGLLYSDRDADSFRPARRAVLALNTLSFVHDTSLWFSTGPIDGMRANLTVGLNTNLERVEIENGFVLADLRRYFRTGLRTAYAVRLQGRISEGSLPQRFLLGGSWSLRGYPRRGLVGTRAVLLNQEWRFPLLDGILLGLPIGAVGLPPVQGAFFLDAAQAWEEGEQVDEVLGSFGLGLRTNIAGFLVLRLDLAKRTDFQRVRPRTEVDFFVGYNY